MDPQEKLGKSLVVVNLAGLALAASFTFLGGILTGLIGFLIGIFGSTTLIYRKNQD